MHKHEKYTKYHKMYMYKHWTDKDYNFFINLILKTNYIIYVIYSGLNKVVIY